MPTTQSDVYVLSVGTAALHVQLIRELEFDHRVSGETAHTQHRIEEVYSILQVCSINCRSPPTRSLHCLNNTLTIRGGSIWCSSPA